MRNGFGRCAFLSSVLLMLSLPTVGWCAAPLADVHVYYKWNRKEVTRPEQAIETLRANDVGLPDRYRTSVRIGGHGLTAKQRRPV